MEINITFKVIQDEGEKSELDFALTFEKEDFENLNIESFTEKDYDNIQSNIKVLTACKKYINSTDSYLLENSSFYSLRIVKISEFDLNFLWKNEDILPEDCNSLNDFLTKNTVAIDAKNYLDFLMGFKENYFCSLDYVKT